CFVWVNGREVARFHVRPGDIAFDGVAEKHEAGDEPEEKLIENAAALLTPGTNLIAIQAFNASRNSTDLTIDAELRTPEGAARGRRPTPGATNSVFSAITPPSVTEVKHVPLEPKSGDVVTVSARVTDPD